MFGGVGGGRVVVLEGTCGGGRGDVWGWGRRRVVG